MRIHNILFPVDFSDRSKAAAPFVHRLAKLYDANVTLLHSCEPLPMAAAPLCLSYPEVSNFEELEAEQRTMLLKFATSELPRIPFSVVVQTGPPADLIRSTAAAIHADLVMMPTHGYGAFRRLCLGSVTAKALHELQIPIWTDAHAPEPSHRAHPLPRRILAAVDFKRESGQNTEFALQLGQDTGAQVEMVYAAPEGAVAPEPSKTRTRGLVTVAAGVGEIEVDEKGDDVDTAIDDANPAHRLRDLAVQKRVDLMVIGRGSIRNILDRFGSHAFDIIRESPCPVISV